MGHLGRGKNALEDRESILRLVWCDRGPSTRSEKKDLPKRTRKFLCEKKRLSDWELQMQFNTYVLAFRKLVVKLYSQN